MALMCRLIAGSLLASRYRAYPQPPSISNKPIHRHRAVCGRWTDRRRRAPGERTICRARSARRRDREYRGAGGTLGDDPAVRRSPTAYTIAVGNMGDAVGGARALPNLKYDPATSFAQVGIVNYTPQAIVAKKDTAAKTLKEFIDYLKAHNTSSPYATPGLVRSPRVGPRLQREVRPHANLDALSRHRASHPRPRGRRDRLHGRPSLNVIPQIQAGTIKVYAIAASERSRACRTCRRPGKPVSTSSSAPGTPWSPPRARRRRSSQCSRRAQQGAR